jgi:hypothetical protein
MSAVHSDDTRYQRARKRVDDLKGFYTHLAVYACVNICLFLINWVTNPDDWWFFYPLFGWGVAVAIHAVVTFGIEGPLGRGWEDRKIRELMDQEQPR